MMLPSGNDAAVMIAEIGGCLLKVSENPNFDLKNLEDTEFMTELIQR